MLPPDPDEQDLLRRLRSGSRAAFEALLDRTERRVYNLAFRLLSDASEAEDAVQEIYVEVHRSLPRFRGDSRLDTWIHRIAVNVCLQRRRRRTLPTVALSDTLDWESNDPEPHREIERAELRRYVEGAVQDLPEGLREVVLLHEMQGLTYAEVAQVLGCPVGTVKSRLSAAFRRMRQTLAEYVLPDAGSAANDHPRQRAALLGDPGEVR